MLARPRAFAAALIVLVLGVSGCAADSPRPADSAPAVPSSSAAPPPPDPPTASASQPAPLSPSAQPSAPASEPIATASPEPVSAGWKRFEVGDGHTSWSMPAGWTAEIDSVVVEGRAEWTDYSGLVRDEAGSAMLRFEAIASGGQYATDFSPCERPEAEVFEVAALGAQVADPAAAVVSLAVDDGTGGVTFAAGVSELDAGSACEPEILALYQDDAPAGYDFVLLQIVDDQGSAYPRFAGFDAARAYLDSPEYALIRGVLASFESR